VFSGVLENKGADFFEIFEKVSILIVSHKIKPL
jgi:hypothetical protein